MPCLTRMLLPLATLHSSNEAQHTVRLLLGFPRCGCAGNPDLSMLNIQTSSAQLSGCRLHMLLVLPLQWLHEGWQLTQPPPLWARHSVLPCTASR